MNDIVINWERLRKGIPSGLHAAIDRAPTREEIQRLLHYPDRRQTNSIRNGVFRNKTWYKPISQTSILSQNSE